MEQPMETGREIELVGFRGTAWGVEEKHYSRRVSEGIDAYVKSAKRSRASVQRMLSIRPLKEVERRTRFAGHITN